MYSDAGTVVALTHLEDITHVLVQFLDVFHPPLELELVDLYTHAFASLRVAVSSRMLRHRQRHLGGCEGVGERHLWPRES